MLATALSMETIRKDLSVEKWVVFVLVLFACHFPVFCGAHPLFGVLKINKTLFQKSLMVLLFIYFFLGISVVFSG